MSIFTDTTQNILFDKYYKQREGKDREVTLQKYICEDTYTEQMTLFAEWVVYIKDKDYNMSFDMDHSKWREEKRLKRILIAEKW